MHSMQIGLYKSLQANGIGLGVLEADTIPAGRQQRVAKRSGKHCSRRGRS